MPEITTKQNFDVEKIVRIAFVLLIVGFYFFGLNIPLLGPDEPRYAQVAREMFERGDWITPTLGGFNWFEKPALLYWLEIGSYKIFGVSEFSARVGSALFGLGTLFCLWLLGRSVGTRDQRRLGDWLVLIAASTIGLIVFSRGASFDIILTFPVTASLVSFFIYERRSENERGEILPLILFYFFIGVALLAKGLVGIILPFGIVGLYYVLRWRFPSKTFLMSLLWGTLLSALVAAIWYVPMYRLHGWQFIDEFIIQHHFQRFTSNKYQHPQPFYFFLWVLPLMTIPWLPFFIAAVWKFVREQITTMRGRTVAEAGDGVSRLRLFAFAWMAVPVAFFSLSGSKLPSYILPSLPGAIILTAIFVWRLADRRRPIRIGVAVTAAVVFIVLAVLMVTTVTSYADADSVKKLIATADSSGTAKPVLMFHTVSHNAEFYAPGRIIREPNGQQRKFLSLDELVGAVGTSGGSAIVLTPIPYLEQLKTETRINYRYIADNGEIAAADVSLK